MKTKFLLFGLISIFSINGLAQNNSVVVTSNKVKYERKGKDVSEYKKTFEVNYPKFSGIKNPVALKNLENTVSYWKVFETTLEENLGDYYWLDSLDYQITYNKNSLMVIDLRVDGSGAYPDYSTKTFVVNLNTGKRIFIRDAFTNVGQLLVKVDKAQKAEVKQHLAELKKDNAEDYSAAREMLAGKRYTASTLDEFYIDDKGVTFIFNYEFPHAVQALAPDGRYFFTWAELKPFIKPNGLLGRFVR
ncbi:MAG: hypothetical protein ACR2J3_08670 [Aridibacter sp.]